MGTEGMEETAVKPFSPASGEKGGKNVKIMAGVKSPMRASIYNRKAV